MHPPRRRYAPYETRAHPKVQISQLFFNWQITQLRSPRAVARAQSGAIPGRQTVSCCHILVSRAASATRATASRLRECSGEHFASTAHALQRYAMLCFHAPSYHRGYDLSLHLRVHRSLALDYAWILNLYSL